MKAILHHNQPFAGSKAYKGTFSINQTGIGTKLTAWLNAQEEKRFFWAAISLLGHGTLFTIATMATVIFTGNIFALLVITCLTMTTVLVVNLAALPVKYTVSVFFLSLLTDVLVMITALALWI